MRALLARWRPGHVVAAWFAYWIGLAGVTLTPTVRAIVHATSAPSNTSNVSASFNNATLSVTVSQLGKVTHVAAASLGEIALWVGLPPLILYGVWMFTRPRRPAEPAALGESAPDALPRPDVPQPAPSPSVHSRAPHA